MAKSRKKKKKSRRQRRGTARPVSRAGRLQQARRFLDQGKGAQALEQAALLLEQDPGDEEARDLYRRAARHCLTRLAGEGRYAQALNLLRKAPEAARLPCGPLEEMVLLLGAGRVDEALALLAAQEQGETRTAMEQRLGALLLARPGLEQNLPPDLAPLARDAALARKALEALCQDAMDEARSVARKISLRSPLGGVRRLVEGAALMGGGPEDVRRGRRVLERLAAEGPPLADAARALLLGHAPDGGQALALLASSPRPQVLCPAAGLDPGGKAAALLNALAREAVQDETGLTRLVLRRLRGLPPGRLRQDLARWFLPHARTRPATHFNPTVLGSRQALEQVQALWFERGDYLEDALDHWENLANMLEQEARGAQEEGSGETGEPDPRAMRAALVAQRLARTARKVFEGAPWLMGGAQIQHRLERAVALDPEHRPLWDELLRVLEDSPNADRQIPRILDQALRHFPRDPALLARASRLALQRQAFKKAATLARRILDEDPYHPEARRLLVDATVAHGIRLVKRGKRDLANRNFLSLEGLDLEDRAGLPAILVGLGDIYHGLPESGEEALRAGREAARTPLHGALLTAMYGHVLHLPQLLRRRFRKELRQAAALPCPQPLAYADVASWINRAGPDELLALAHVLPSIKTWFNPAASMKEIGEDLARRLCLALKRAGLYVQLRRLAKARRSQGDFFRVMEIAADCYKTFRPPRRKEAEVLLQALMRAEKEGDRDLIDVADDLLDRYAASGGDFSFFPGPDGPGLPGNVPQELVEAMMEELAREAGQDTEDLDGDGEPPWPFGPGPGPGRPGKRGPGARGRKGKKSSKPASPTAKQLNLFDNQDDSHEENT